MENQLTDVRRKINRNHSYIIIVKSMPYHAGNQSYMITSGDMVHYQNLYSMLSYRGYIYKGVVYHAYIHCMCKIVKLICIPLEVRMLSQYL